MTFEENEKIKATIRKRFKEELHPEDCEYCGGFHHLKLMKDGMNIETSKNTCSELTRRANEIIRDTRKKYNAPYYLKE